MGESTRAHWAGQQVMKMQATSGAGIMQGNGTVPDGPTLAQVGDKGGWEVRACTQSGRPCTRYARQLNQRQQHEASKSHQPLGPPAACHVCRSAGLETQPETQVLFACTLDCE